MSPFTYTPVHPIDATADVEVTFEMDEETFRSFYDRTARPLWAYLARITGDRQAADDLLQESYYRLLRAKVALQDESHRRHYLFRIATNLARDGYRRRAAGPDLVEADIEKTTAPVTRPDVRVDVRRAMARLKRRERELLWLAYAQGSSHEEIGRALGLRTGSIKPLLFRARRRLAALLGGKGNTRG